MGASGFGSAPHFNLDEFQRRLREVVQKTAPNGAPSKLPRLTESSIPLSHPALSKGIANTLERGKKSTEPLDVRPSTQSHQTHDTGTSVVDADDPRAFDLDNFRRWWRQSSAREAAQDRSRGQKLTRMASALAGIGLVGSALALKGVAPTLMKTPPLSLPANDIARVQNLNSETTGTTSHTSTMPRAGLSGATPIAADAQTGEGLPSKESAQTNDPETARSVSARPGGTWIASEVSSAAERWSAADAPKPPARPAPERVNGAVGTTRPTDSPAKHPRKPTARVVVAKAGADAPSESANTPIPPLPIGNRAKVAKGPIAPATSAEAAKRFSNPLLYVLGDLFGD
jgi:hypothetical protein